MFEIILRFKRDHDRQVKVGLYSQYVTLLKWQSSGFVEDHWCFNNKFTLDVLQFRICRF